MDAGAGVRSGLASGVVPARVRPCLAELVVVEPAEQVRVMVEAVGSAPHLAEVMAVIAGRCFLLGPLTHDIQLLPAQLHDLGQSLLEIHRVLPCAGGAVARALIGAYRAALPADRAYGSLRVDRVPGTARNMPPVPVASSKTRAARFDRGTSRSGRRPPRSDRRTPPLPPSRPGRRPPPRRRPGRPPGPCTTPKTPPSV